MARIIGRESECKILNSLFESDKPEFLAIYGRRRVGKTHLIRRYFREKGVYFEMTGTKDGPMKEQLANFAIALSSTFLEGKRCPIPHNWHAAFELLRKQVEQVASHRRVILFFDELPWMSTPRSDCLRALEHFWNRYLSNQDNIILIVCGSAASWMIKKVINNRGGLYGRLSRILHLLPFTLKDTEQLLKAKGIDLDRKQIVEFYMAVGGVPYYLNLASRGRSSAQMINELFFSRDAPLANEFNGLFESLFDHHEHHKKIVYILHNKPHGLSKNELLELVGLTSGGYSTTVFRELESSGFIGYMPPFGKKQKGGNYILIDELSLLHLNWLVSRSPGPFGEPGDDYWLKIRATRKWTTWAGLAFEILCWKHVNGIKGALGISGVQTSTSTWRFVPREANQEGAQIDLVIDRADRCINLCEIKYSDSPFSVTKTYRKDLERKKRVFHQVTATRKALFTTLVTPFGVKKNSHSIAIVDNEVTLDDLFV
ncbi:MAG: hypothetical protein K940chlam7_01768 [Chlamydiae bacterium]|nr:hypothetical protein [Chlamydiota bacterium]